MNRAKIFIAFTFLLAFAVCVLAQEQTPKIVWKNLQAKYERFEDIKPIIVNVSNQPIYFDCSYEYADQTEDIRLLRFDEKYNYWSENVFACGNKGKRQIKEEREKAKYLRKLVKERKYIPEGCKINPNEEFSLLDETHIRILVNGDGLIEPYESGNFRFKFRFHLANSFNDGISESPDFLVSQKNK